MTQNDTRITQHKNNNEKNVTTIKIKIAQKYMKK